MRLAGDANWWAPRWMKRIHDRIGISESVDLEPAPASTAASTAAAVDAPARLDSVNGSTRDDERVGTP
jgi:RND superfamily putative drug exporter